MNSHYFQPLWLQKSTLNTLAALVTAGLVIGGCAAPTNNATQPSDSTTWLTDKSCLKAAEQLVVR